MPIGACILMASDARMPHLQASLLPLVELADVVVAPVSSGSGVATSTLRWVTLAGLRPLLSVFTLSAHLLPSTHKIEQFRADFVLILTIRRRTFPPSGTVLLQSPETPLVMLRPRTAWDNVSTEDTAAVNAGLVLGPTTAVVLYSELGSCFWKPFCLDLQATSPPWKLGGVHTAPPSGWLVGWMGGWVVGWVVSQPRSVHYQLGNLIF